MSLYLLRDWTRDLDSMRPSRMLDQHFGLGLTHDDLISPLNLTTGIQPLLLHRNYYRPWRVQSQDTGSTVHCDKDNFRVNLDVQQFTPEEIKVKVVDNCVTVEAKHEEKEDEHGYISRHFVRRYVLPKEYKVDQITSSLSSDGVLTISAPRLEAIESGEKVIPIQSTGVPHRAVKEKEKEAEPEKK